MTISGKHFDPILGLDIHIILLPTPAGPVPTPLPHAYVGFMMDMMDYVPFLGASVKVNNLPRSQAGSSGMAVPVHIPMGGPFQKPPSHESEMFMGSATVLVDGEPHSFTALPALTCQDIGMPAPLWPKKQTKTKSLVLPTTTLLAIPMGMAVLVGGSSTISMSAMAMKAGMAVLGQGLK